MLKEISDLKFKIIFKNNTLAKDYGISIPVNTLIDLKKL